MTCSQLINLCDKEDFPELFTLITLQICQIGCPKKIPPKTQTRSSVHIPSRRKRKLQTQLEVAKCNPHSPPAQIESLNRKLALAHMDIRDAINQDLQYREQQAVSKVKENPKYFYSYAKKFSKKKSNISMLFDGNGAIKSNPKDIANLLQKQFLSVFSDPSKTNIDSASFSPPQIKHSFTDLLSTRSGVLSSSNLITGYLNLHLKCLLFSSTVLLMDCNGPVIYSERCSQLE